MRTIHCRITVTCDRPGCGRTAVVFDWHRDERLVMPVPPTLPPGWRARLTLERTEQNTCSLECERALLDAEKPSGRDRLKS